MKIKDSLYTTIQTLEGSQPEETGRNRKKAGKSGSEGDQVTLSEHARDLSRTMKATADAQDVRTDKVQALKERVQSGTYQPDSGAIARKLLQEDLDLWG